MAAYNFLMPTFSLTRPLPQHQLLMRLFWMRCIATLAQALLVAVAVSGMHLSLPLPPLCGVLGLLVAFNVFSWWRTWRAAPVSNAELFLQLFIDVSALTAMLYFTGGATNPFVSFYLPALAVAAAILPTPYAIALALYSLICYSLLTVFYQPLHVHDANQGMAYHLAGMWLNFLVSAALITWFVARMSATLRGRDAQLAQAREQQLLDEQIVALGTQAASAAHEMNTPLATVALIAGELCIEAGRNDDLRLYREDLAIVEQQIALCKTALDRMGMVNPSSQIDTSLSLAQWLRHFFDSWRLRHPALAIRLSMPESTGPVRHPQLLAQVLSTLLDNAAQAVGVNGKVDLELSVQDACEVFRVCDNGPGIDAEMLKRLGYEPVRSTTGGKGIGLMLAFATARQIGARLTLASAPENGTTALLMLAWESAPNDAANVSATLPTSAKTPTTNARHLSGNGKRKQP